jgi:hypothetical protein
MIQADPLYQEVAERKISSRVSIMQFLRGLAVGILSLRNAWVIAHRLSPYHPVQPDCPAIESCEAAVRCDPLPLIPSFDTDRFYSFRHD